VSLFSYQFTRRVTNLTAVITVHNERLHQLLIDFKKAYESVRKDLLYNIRAEFEVFMKSVRLIKMCLNETYSKVRIGKHLSDSFPNQNGLKQGDALSPLLFHLKASFYGVGLNTRPHCSVSYGNIKISPKCVPLDVRLKVIRMEPL
jgi:hypothetical protein